jgi:hypothetical protein
MSDSIQSLTLKTVSLEHLFNNAIKCATAYPQPVPLELMVSPTAPKQWSVTAMHTEAELSESTPIQNTVHSIRGFLQDRRRSLLFQRNEDTGLVTTTVLDSDNQKVVRKIPLEQALKLIT